MSNFTDVGDFHERFGLPRSEASRPAEMLDPETYDFRKRFMQEELDEFTEAYAEGDMAGMFDALLDLVYVAMGTAHFMSLPWELGWTEVQRANMTKIRAQSADESKRDSAWDVVKPPGWTAPDIEAVLEAHQIFSTRGVPE